LQLVQQIKPKPASLEQLIEMNPIRTSVFPHPVSKGHNHSTKSPVGSHGFVRLLQHDAFANDGLRTLNQAIKSCIFAVEKRPGLGQVEETFQ
jgi:hypothetical protein